MPRVLAFDVNETLLDLRALDPHFERVFGDKAVRREWFQQMLQNMFVTIATDRYADFGTIGRGALEMVAERRQVTLSDEHRQTILGTIRQLPPHPEVKEQLGRLRAAGFRMAALTNSTAQTAEAQLAHAGIRDLFEEVLSADAVKRLKPAPEPYRMVAQRFGVALGEVRLVAAHAWDVAGALAAGCAAAFVARPGMVLDPGAPRPGIFGKDLREVADQIIERDRDS